MSINTLVLIISTHVAFIATLIFIYKINRPKLMDLEVLNALFQLTHSCMVDIAVRNNGRTDAYLSDREVVNAIRVLKEYKHPLIHNLVP